MQRGLRKRAPNTVEGRGYQVEALTQHFGSRRLDHIDIEAITAWWDEFVERGGRSARTGKGYLNVLSLVFRHAAKRWPDLANPIPQARAAILGEIQNTAAYRARDQENCNPLSTEELQRLLP